MYSMNVLIDNGPSPETGDLTMLTTTRQTKAATIERSINLEICKDGSVFGTVLEIANRKRTAQAETKSYFLRKMDADFGDLAMEVERVDGDGEVYHVHQERGVMSCSCPAGTYRGKCRHLDLLLEAKRLGMI